MAGLLDIFAGIGLFVGDIYAIFSFVGSLILFIAAIVSNKPMNKFGEIGNWSILGLVFGGFCQIAIAITHMPVTTIGFIFKLPLLLVNGLLFLSLLMVIGRFILRRIPR